MPIQSAGAGTIRPGDPHAIAGTVAGRDQRRKPGGYDRQLKLPRTHAHELYCY